MDVTDDKIGTRFDGRYLIEKQVGSGGMAKVYLAKDETLGRHVAIKVLGARHATDGAFVERFLREASAAAKLNHPNIVQVYDRGMVAGEYYIAMEYVDGTTLKSLIQSRGVLDQPEVLDYGRQALNALRFAHRNGIVHRDVKPHNMMVDTEGRLKIADFGIARAGSDTGLTEVGSIVGTAQYLSPEQAQGQTVSATSDLYSLGVVLFEMATGRVPYEGDSPVNVALRHVNDPVPRPRDVNAGISPALEAIIVRAMQKDPARRYETADEMLKDLDSARTGTVSEDTAAITRIVAPSASTAGTRVLPAQPGGGTRVQPLVPPARLDAGSSYAMAQEWGADDDDDPTPAPTRSSSKRWLWLLAIIALIAVAGGLWLLTSNSEKDTPKTPTVSVPDTVGMRRAAAVAKLRSLGLATGEVQRKFSDEEPAGTIIEQSPEGGTTVDKGSQVDLVISNGAKPIAMPGVIGKTQSQAMQAIVGAGLPRPSIQREYSDTVKEGVVTSQTPAEGTEIKPGATVVIVVSKGAEDLPVPNLVGSTQADATQQLKDLGLLVSIKQSDSEQAKGTVLDQDPGSGTQATKGDTVTLTVASGYNAAPDVVDMAPEDAESAIQAAGFVPQTGSEIEDPSMAIGDPDKISAQDPASGQRLQLGATITLTVAHAPAGP